MNMNIFYPLELIANFLTFQVFKLSPEIQLASSVEFFIYDGLKIFLLLIFITHLMSYIRLKLPVKKFKEFLSNRKLYGIDVVLASGFGALTPFCSCSSIPLFIGFLQAGLPIRVVFAFLITSPLVNEIALALFLGLFGIKITLFYLFAGMGIGIIGGFLLEKLGLEKYIERFEGEEEKKKCCCCKNKKPQSTFSKVSREAFVIIRKITPYVLIGLAVGALIHGFVPANFFEEKLALDSIFAVPLAVIFAVPLYSNASGIIPILQALIDKGVPFGTALAFMMATIGLSLPEAMMLKRVLKLKALLIFFSVVAVGIMLIGFLFNIIL